MFVEVKDVETGRRVCINPHHINWLLELPQGDKALTEIDVQDDLVVCTDQPLDDVVAKVEKAITMRARPN